MKFIEEAKNMEKELIKYRRDFHKHPELGMEETRTSGIVADFLRELGLKVQTNVANTGVVGILYGKADGPTIGLRADMDALPINEQTRVSYSSIYPNKMHACGHDGHTAILMGAAKLLTKHKDELQGNVKFIFQPAEEGPGGALPMIKEGVLEDPKVEAVFGLHLNTSSGGAGQIEYGYGPRSAGTATVNIKIKGFGGHGAHPHKSKDAIMASAYVLTQLQTIISREIDPLEPVVITMGTINGGYRHNVIADEVIMSGTVRTLNEQVRSQMPKRFDRIISGVCQSLSCDYELDYKQGVPSVVNDKNMTDLVKKSAEEILGKENTVYIEKPSMGGEDFCYFSRERPSSFFRLSARNEAKGCKYPGHHPKYNFDESSIAYGVAMFAQIVTNYFNK